MPGPVEDVVVSAGNDSVIITFNKPSTGVGPFTYFYNFPLAVQLPVNYNSTGLDNENITFNLSSDYFSIGQQATVTVTARDSTGIDSAPVTVTSDDVLVAADVPFNYVENTGSTGSINVSAALTDSSVAAGDTATVTVTDGSILDDNTASVTIGGKASVDSSMTFGYVSPGDSNNSDLFVAADEVAASVNGTVGVSFAGSATGFNVNGDNVQLNTPVDVTVEQTFDELPGVLADALARGVSAIGDAYRWDGAELNLVGTGTTSVQGNKATTDIKLVMTSIFVIIYRTSSGTTITVPVENNQAYNDYLHDESGYQNRRENRLLTSGFYRGPVDSSTLTRIRSANGVLRGVPGIPGGMQGSRCCR